MENSVSHSGALHSFHHVRRIFSFPLGIAARENPVGLKSWMAAHGSNMALRILAESLEQPHFSSKLGHMCVLGCAKLHKAWCVFLKQESLNPGFLRREYSLLLVSNYMNTLKKNYS